MAITVKYLEDLGVDKETAEKIFVSFATLFFRPLPLLRLPSSATGGGRLPPSRAGSRREKERFARRLPPPTRTRASLSSTGRKGFAFGKPRFSNLPSYPKTKEPYPHGVRLFRWRRRRDLNSRAGKPDLHP